MVQAITRKLHGFNALSQDDVSALEGALHDTNSFAAHRDIVRDGDSPSYALAILSGWAFRYKVLKDGSRQITAFLLPGDFCHLNALASAPMDHSIAALSPVTIARIDRPWIAKMIDAHPSLAKAVQASQFADEARLRASIISLGRKDAAGRIGYLLCDLWSRAEAVGLINGDCLEFPPTQADIADAVGLTAVHVNRVMQRLRHDRLVRLNGRCLTLPDFGQLARICGYETSAVGVARPYTSSSDTQHFMPPGGARTVSRDTHAS